MSEQASVVEVRKVERGPTIKLVVYQPDDEVTWKWWAYRLEWVSAGDWWTPGPGVRGRARTREKAEQDCRDAADTIGKGDAFKLIKDPS